MLKQDLTKFKNDINSRLNNDKGLIFREIRIGKVNPIPTLVVYNKLLSDKDIIDRDIFNALMHFISEDLSLVENINDCLLSTYISVGNSHIENDFNNIIEALKRGRTIIYTENSSGYIVMDTKGGKFRETSEPENESSIKDNREGFVENIEFNISLLRRRLKDESFSTEMLTLGQRSQTDIALVYLSDIIDDTLVPKIKERLNSINIDRINSAGIVEQFIEHDAYSIFPQYLSTQRPDKVSAAMCEGKVAIIIEGTPSVLLAPSVFFNFLQSVDDYDERTVVASFTRLIRMFAMLVVITLPSIYLTLLKFNTELIPVKFINPIIQSRSGIALTPFLEILAMEVLVEFLREGGLRLPSKIAQTLSVVGGIIIGDTAIQSKIVSPTTLLIVGVTVVASFLIPNYDMALSIRFLRFPMLILANTLGIFGIGLGTFYLLMTLFSMENYGVEYLSLNKGDMKDIFIRAPLWKMNKRPTFMNNKDDIRQVDLRKNWNDEDKNNGESNKKEN